MYVKRINGVIVGCARWPCNDHEEHIDDDDPELIAYLNLTDEELTALREGGN